MPRQSREVGQYAVHLRSGLCLQAQIRPLRMATRPRSWCGTKRGKKPPQSRQPPLETASSIPAERGGAKGCAWHATSLCKVACLGEPCKGIAACAACSGSYPKQRPASCTSSFFPERTCQIQSDEALESIGVQFGLKISWRKSLGPILLGIASLR